MARKFTFRGKSIEELTVMPVDDFITLLPSKPRRAMRRMGVQLKKFLVQFRKKSKSQKPFKTQVRTMVVLPEMVGKRFQVYNGKQYVDVLITDRMLGHRLGDFSNPIQMVRHSGPGIGATRGSKAVELK